MQYRKVTTLTIEECSKQLQHTANVENYKELIPNVNENFICTANTNGSGLCYGDSGNPLVFNEVLIGIASWNIECAQIFPDVYTKVYPHMDWIETEMKKLSKIF